MDLIIRSIYFFPDSCKYGLHKVDVRRAEN